jgi:phosphoglycerate kinase
MAVKRAPKRSVIVLENLRFYSEEEANDSEFAAKLAKDSGARFFVQDGFGVVHRAHASTAAITQYLPSVAGLLLEREYTTVTNAMKAPKRPLVAVMGGAKVADKIAVIDEFIRVADTIVIGGAMANTFLAYKGLKLGKSKFEPDEKAIIDEIYRAATKKVGADKVDEFIVLPTDLAVGHSVDASEERRNVSITAVGDTDMALDVGDASVEAIVKVIEQAQTVIWNGTLGYAELPQFAHGSARLALTLATHPDITSIIGGGDTADFVLHWDARKGDSFTHVSTGGGASLELMAGEKLPGIESLLDA